MQGVDDRITSHKDELVRYTLLKKCLVITLRRSEVVGRKLRDQAPVHLLRKRAERISGAKPSLDMAYRDFVVEAGERSGHGGRGITLYQNKIWALRVHNRVEL